MTTPRYRIGGLLRCCLSAMPTDGDHAEGATFLCLYCKQGGMSLITRDGEHAWEATWITKGHDWRSATRTPEHAP